MVAESTFVESPILPFVGEKTQTILIVDPVDYNRRLLRAMLKASSYSLLEARHATEALSIVERAEVDLLITELVLPEMSGLELARKIKSNRRTHLVPVLMLAAMQGVDHEIAGIANGADEYLTRPLHPELVRTRVRAMLRNKAAVDSLEEAESILIALAQAVEKRDKYTGDHCDRLAYYSVLLGRAMGLAMPDLVALHRGGYLHDIGKIAVPDAVLFKPGALTAEEWEVMRSHTWKGEEICRPMKTLAKVLPIIRNHHERWDGTGYPDGLKGEKIPLLARILQMADIYDALTTARPYKRAYTHVEAMAMFDEEVRKGWRDPELVSLFQQVCPPVEEDPSGEGMGRFRESLDNLRRELFK